MEEPKVVLTEQGKRPVRFFIAYPTTNATQFATLAAVLLLFTMVLGGVMTWRNMPVPEPAEPVHDGWPAERVTIADLSEAVLSGLASGRTAAAVFNNEEQNVRLMQEFDTACATPWLRYASTPDRPADAVPMRGVVEMNVLSVAGLEKPLINARITHRSNETLMVVAPFKFKNARNMRVFSKHVHVTHARGVYETTDAAVAVCIQELYE